jgi:hypothetical protein
MDPGSAAHHFVLRCARETLRELRSMRIEVPAFARTVAFGDRLPPRLQAI